MTTDRIRINCSGIVVSSAVIAGLSLFACIKSSPGFKSISAILFFSSASVGVVTKLKSNMDERDANAGLAQIIESLNSASTDLTKQLKTVASSNQKLQLTAANLTEKLNLSTNEVKLLETDCNALKTDLQLANEQIRLKAQELANNERVVDKRFQDFSREFVGKVIITLYDKINQAYNSLDANCLILLSREEYVSIHAELAKFRSALETHHDRHIALARDLEEFDYSSIYTLVDASIAASEVMTSYDQITDEILAFKIKYRNLKTLDERRALLEFQETEEYKTTKAAAIQTLREQTGLDKSVIDKLKSGLNANTNGLTELITGIGSDLEKANERVAQLSAPITWKFALNHATRVGNLIIEYCRTNRVHLDRSHYTGDAHEVDLYFFTDRINAAQTVDLKALNDEGDKLAQITHCIEPIKFIYQYESRLLVAHAVLQNRIVEKKQPTNPVEAVRQFLKPHEALLPFIKDAFHVGLWSSTGGGKTTAISNVIGGMIEDLGGAPTIRLTIPKMDADTQAMFPEVHWLGLLESIFGLLEAALEIQYRIWRNEQAYRAKEVIQDYQPTLFFVDEINAIFTRWKKINENDLNDVLDRFEATLAGDRLNYFQSWMRLELTNYKEQFASKLLLFIWQTGRSLRVKSLIAGQNLMPSKLGLTINDLDNCSYISFGDSIKGCSKYKVRDVDVDLINKQYNLLQKAVETEENLKYTALYCPSVGKSFFGTLPPPNYYQWDANLLNLGQAIATPPSQPTPTHANTSKIAETLMTKDVGGGLPQKAGNLTPQPTLKGKDSKSCEFFKQRGLLAEKYQNLDYRGYADLLASLPRKADGSVHKVQAYETVFLVWKKDLRKIYSSFIDWLEANFN